MNKYSKYINGLELNITELCNMKCVFCPRGHGYENQNLNMSMETVDIIISQLDQIPTLKFIYFAGRGEPSLHPKFGELIQKFVDYKNNHNPNLELHLNTNGARLDRYNNQITQLDNIQFSIYDETKEPLEELTRRYKLYNNIQVVDRRTNIKNKSEFNWFNTRAGYVFNSITKGSNFNHPEYGAICEKPFTNLYISWNGDYNLCCNDWEDIQVLGNIYSESIHDYVNYNQMFFEYHDMLAHGKRTMGPCANCNNRCPKNWLDSIKNLKNYIPKPVYN